MLSSAGVRSGFSEDTDAENARTSLRFKAGGASNCSVRKILEDAKGIKPEKLQRSVSPFIVVGAGVELTKLLLLSNIISAVPDCTVSVP